MCGVSTAMFHFLNVQFLFVDITWTKFRVSFHSQNFNELSKSKVNIPLFEHNIHPSNISLLVQEDIFVLYFSTFKQHFQFLAKKVSSLETLQFVQKSCKRGICYCYYKFHFVKNQIQSINKVTYIISIS